ncbi:MAG: hypothetical protein EP305_05100 [Bacteroidetes bacterium]|nr:MAG: hypothetical protein EP305_05100 [Bacteroidota bacterium]
MKFFILFLLGLIFVSCTEKKETAENDQSQDTKIETEIVEKEFSIKGTTWKTEKGGIIIFADEDGTFLYGDENKDRYSEGIYSKFGEKYSLKSAENDLKALGFLSNFGANPLVITIDETEPKSFSFKRSHLEKFGGNFREVEEEIKFVLQ